MKDINVRQAACHSVNKKLIIDRHKAERHRELAIEHARAEAAERHAEQAQAAADVARLKTDVARFQSAVGELKVPVEVTDEVMAGVVSLPHGWGHDRPGTRMEVASRQPGVNSNVLTDPGPIDPLSGNASLNAIPVTLSPATG